MCRLSFVAVSMLALVPPATGCGGEEAATEPPEQPTYDLTFTGDDTFQGAHGGQTIHVGVTNQSTGALVASDEGTVSASADPSFEFTFTGALTEDASYHVDYWIDSNFGGGTEGLCDPPETDHQWRLTVSSVMSDVTLADTHRPTETEPVCGDTDGGPSDPGY